MTPRLRVDLGKIAHNASRLSNLYASEGIGIMGVTKVVCGSPAVAKTLVDSGIAVLADSRWQNLKKMRQAGIRARFVLLRIPSLSEAEQVVRYADISMNTEMAVLRRLSAAALKQGTVHETIVMVELGDLREGIMPTDLERFVQTARRLPGIRVVGIGANLACFGGIRPDKRNMDQLSRLANKIERRLALPLTYVSGGTSANYKWFVSAESRGAINNLRLGEAIYLGREPLDREPIPGLYTDAFALVAEVIEAKTKPSKPYGETGQDAFGNRPRFEDQGPMRRGLLGVGAQDVPVTGLQFAADIEILGASSDHTVIDLKQTDLQVGDEVAFSVNYGSLLALMTSPYVEKEYIPVRASAAAESACVKTASGDGLPG